MLAKFETSRTFPSYYPGGGWGWGWVGGWVGVEIIRIKAISVQSIEIGLTGTELGKIPLYLTKNDCSASLKFSNVLLS